MDDLKPCPFCGGPAEMHKPRQREMQAADEKFLPRFAKITRISSIGTIYYIIPGYTPRCCNSSCPGRLGKRWPSEESAAEAWNRRANDEQIDK